jgi:hypothetical protein
MSPWNESEVTRHKVFLGSLVYRGISRRVGLIVVRYSEIEALSHRFAWSLLGWDERRGQLITAGMPVEKVWDLFEDGISSQESRRHLLPRFQTWREKATKLKKARDHAVHSEWWLDPTTEGAPADGTGPRGRRPGGRRWPMFENWRSTLEESAEELERAAIELLEIFREILAADQVDREKDQADRDKDQTDREMDQADREKTADEVTDSP